MEIGIPGEIFTHKNIKGSMVQRCPYQKKWDNNIVAIIHMYEVRVIFLIFYDNQYTKYESGEIEIEVDGPIFTQKSKSLRNNDINTPQNGTKILQQLFICM